MKKYKVIYADPAWEYRQSGSEKNSRGMAKQHYKTMSTQEICDLPVKELVDSEGGVCLMWATFPNIDQALIVMKAWGFTYKTACFVWIKKNKKSNSNFWGMGAYTRANAEVCLLGISKNAKAKEMVKSHAVHQVIETPIERHSKKPDIVRELIQKLFGDVNKIELFAREKKEGWDSWGNEIESDIQL